SAVASRILSSSVGCCVTAEVDIVCTLPFPSVYASFPTRRRPALRLDSRVPTLNPSLTRAGVFVLHRAEAIFQFGYDRLEGLRVCRRTILSSNRHCLVHAEIGSGVHRRTPCDGPGRQVLHLVHKHLRVLRVSETIEQANAPRVRI